MSIADNIVVNNDIHHETVEAIDSIIIYESTNIAGKKQALTLNLVGTTPAHLKGWELVKKRDLIMVGVSMGNGYFNHHRLEVILTGMATYFSEVVVLIPDLPALHTYRAVGYNKGTAKEKIRKHRKDIRSCCKHISQHIEESYGKTNLKIITWNEVITQGTLYQEAYHHAFETYLTHPEFRRDIEQSTQHYILGRLEGQELQSLGGMDAVVKEAVYYLIEEMAFHEIFHVILGKEPISCYYRELALVPNYISGNYGNFPNQSAGWIVYNIS